MVETEPQKPLEDMVYDLPSVPSRPMTQASKSAQPGAESGPYMMMMQMMQQMQHEVSKYKQVLTGPVKPAAAEKVQPEGHSDSDGASEKTGPLRQSRGKKEQRRVQPRIDPSSDSSDSDCYRDERPATSQRVPDNGAPMPETSGKPGRRGAQALRQLPKYLSYDGKSSWRSFQVKFTQYAEAFGWSEADKRVCLLHCLTGKALDCCVHQMSGDSKLSYHKLAKKLDGRFGAMLPDSAQAMFNNAKQHKNESIEDWSDRVYTLASEAFTDLPGKFVNRQAVNRFCQGLLDEKAGQHAYMNKCQTVEAAMNDIRLFQQFQNSASTGKVRRPATTATDYEGSAAQVCAVQGAVGNPPDITALQKEMSELKTMFYEQTQQMKQLLQSGSGGHSPTTVKRCYCCGEEGHFRRNCPRNHSKLSLLLAIGGVGGEIVMDDLVGHGFWSNSRAATKVNHMTCTYPITKPVKHMQLTLRTSIYIHNVKTWSLDEYPIGDDSSDAKMYFNKAPLYPPRVVFNFHLLILGSYMNFTGNCTFEELDDTLFELLVPGGSPEILPPHTIEPSTPQATETASLYSETSPWSTATTRPNLGNEMGLWLDSPCFKLRSAFPDRLDIPVSQPQPFHPSQEQPEDTTGGTPIPIGGLLPPGVFILPTDIGTGLGTTPLSNLPPRFPPRRPPGNLLQPQDDSRIKRNALPPSADVPGVNGLVPPPPLPPFVSDVIPINYTRAIELSLDFYRAQRSGQFDNVDRTSPMGWTRPSGLSHEAWDGTDLTGGWYAGNDNMKISFPMAASVTVLAWGYETWKDTYDVLGLSAKMEETLKWPLDYFMKTYNKDTDRLFTMIGNLTLERSLWYRADDEVYNQIWEQGKWYTHSNSRLSPGSDVAAEIASAMALSSMIFADQNYARQLLSTARDLYGFAKRYPGTYSSTVPVGSEGYPDYTSSGYHDEMCMAAAIMYKVDGDPPYLEEAESFFDTGDPEYFDWDDKRVACALLLYKATNKTVYEVPVKSFVYKWLLKQTTPDGLTYGSENGTLRHTANAVFIALMAAEYGVIEEYSIHRIYVWAASQLDYMLGNNDMRKSYQILYGETYVTNPYHKTSACPHPAKGCGWAFYNSSTQNVNNLPGALVGGPDRNGYHADNRQNTIGNSVALDYNAGFQSALAGIQTYKQKLQSECEHAGNPEVPMTETSYPSTPGLVPTSPTPYTTHPPTAVPSRPTTFDYEDALQKSILFFEAQKSGMEPRDNRILWRQWDQSPLSHAGGWYDDGSSIKTTKVMAAATTILGWGAVEFKEAYDSAGLLQDVYRSMRWSLDYLKSCYDSEGQKLLVKVGNEFEERGYWRPHTDRNDIWGTYVAYKAVDWAGITSSGADVAGEVAAALAVGAKLFMDIDAGYAASLEKAAVEVYALMKDLNGSYVDTESVYYSSPDKSTDDEACIAAWWLHEVMPSNTKYYSEALEFGNKDFGTSDYALTWSDRHVLCEILTARNNKHVNKYKLKVQRGLKQWYGARKTVVDTPDGLAWYSEGPLNYAANAAFLAVLAMDIADDDETLHTFAKSQIDYMLGDNSRSFSYQIGYGNRYPRRPHHRASSCAINRPTCDWSTYNSPNSNPNELTGALVAGPDVTDFYEDVRSNTTMNRVSVIANAGFQSTLAGLLHYSMSRGTPTTPSYPESGNKDQEVKTPTFKPPTNPTGTGSPQDLTGVAIGLSNSANAILLLLAVHVVFIYLKM